MENVSWFEKQSNWFENSRFGAMSIMMTFISCYASIAAMYSIKSHFYVGLAIAAATAMAANTAFIAQVNSKICMALFYAGLIINTALLVINFAS